MLAEGSYFIGEDIPRLCSKPEYHNNLTRKNAVYLYYISQPLEVDDNSKQFLLKVDSSSYLDVVDYVDNNISELAIKQAEMKLDMVLSLPGDKNIVRYICQCGKIIS